MLDQSAWPRVRRLLGYLEEFTGCFSARLQSVSLRRYLEGLLGDSPRKSMQAMLTRVTDPGHYQNFQHFITHATWESVAGLAPAAGAVAGARRDVGDRRHQLPETRQALRRRRAPVLRRAGQDRQLPSGDDGACFGRRAAPGCLGAALYLPKEWTRDRARCERVDVPTDVRFQEKWRLALTLLRRARAAGLRFTAVLADAAYGDVTVFRETLHRLDLPYAVGISSHLTVFLGTPRVAAPVATPRRGRPATRVRLIDDVAPLAVSRLAGGLPARAWRVITWRNEHQPTCWRAEFAAVRVTPAHEWRRGRLAPKSGSSRNGRSAAERSLKYFFIHLPSTTALKRLVWIAHQRWAIEQQYQQLKDELGLDHFEGRSYPAGTGMSRSPPWHTPFSNRNVGTPAVRRSRFRRCAPSSAEIFTALYFAANPKQLDYIIQLRRHLPLRI